MPRNKFKAGNQEYGKKNGLGVGGRLQSGHEKDARIIAGMPRFVSGDPGKPPPPGWVVAPHDSGKWMRDPDDIWHAVAAFRMLNLHGWPITRVQRAMEPIGWTRGQIERAASFVESVSMEAVEANRQAVSERRKNATIERRLRRALTFVEAAEIDG